jgi:uncharacterized cupredoxin-like copper-binding protein
MSLSFQKHHAAMLLKYSGISFISGAVNHGFFSGERSLWTAAAGIVMFVAGAWMEHRLADEGAQDDSLAKTLLWGTLLSIGLGFFTGGLQHFPDSPARSAWVVPLGFLISVAALLSQGSSRQEMRRGIATYVVSVGILVGAGSIAAWQWLIAQPPGEAHNHGDTHIAQVASGPIAQVVTRTVDVRMSDEMRFYPSSIQVRAGETVRFSVRNDGKLTHELVIGTDAVIKEHAAAMQKGVAHSHGGGAAISVSPQNAGELVVTFNEPASFQLACLEPGHFEAGMRGTLLVAQDGARPLPQEVAPAPKSAHDSSPHKH